MKDDTSTKLGYGPFTVSDKTFDSLAQVHDFGYLEGSESQGTMTREQFDDLVMRDFGAWLVEQKYIRDQQRMSLHAAKIARAVRYARLRTYQRIVQVFGGLFWEKKFKREKD
jgi:hypothetical protein